VDLISGRSDWQMSVGIGGGSLCEACRTGRYSWHDRKISVGIGGTLRFSTVQSTEPGRYRWRDALVSVGIGGGKV
jgi:hypothetical protein